MINTLATSSAPLQTNSPSSPHQPGTTSTGTAKVTPNSQKTCAYGATSKASSPLPTPTTAVYAVSSAMHSRIKSSRAQEQESLIQNHVHNLIAGLEENIQGNPSAEGMLNLADWYNWTTFDVIGDLSFGEPFNCLRDTMYHP